MDSFKLFAKTQGAATQAQQMDNNSLQDERDNSLVRLSWSSEANAQMMAMGVSDRLNLSASSNMPL